MLFKVLEMAIWMADIFLQQNAGPLLVQSSISIAFLAEWFLTTQFSASICSEAEPLGITDTDFVGQTPFALPNQVSEHQRELCTDHTREST